MPPALRRSSLPPAQCSTSKPALPKVAKPSKPSRHPRAADLADAATALPAGYAINAYSHLDDAHDPKQIVAGRPTRKSLVP